MDKQNNDLLFERFMPIEESVKYRNNSDSWIENSVMPISYHFHGGAIVVGYSSSNKDILYFEHDLGLQVIANNVFEFLMNLNFVVNQELVSKGVYKSYGEDVWRIK